MANLTTGTPTLAPEAAADARIYSPILGTQADDTISGSHRADLISARAGNDSMFAGNGGDLVYGGSGDDRIVGANGNDILYGGGGPSLVNLTNLTIAEDYQGSVTFLNEGAGYRNSLGMYRAAEDGTIYDVDILFPNASKVGSGGDLVGGQSAVALPLQAGDQIGFFIVSNGFGRGAENQALLSDPAAGFVLRAPDGSLGNINGGVPLELWHVDAATGQETRVRSQYGHDLYQSAADPSDDYALNPDNFPHTTGQLNSVEGLITLGFEDLKNGGDKDYDDTVFVVDIGASNARVLDPNIAQLDTGDDLAGTGGGQGTPVAMVASENDVLEGGNGADKLYGMSGDDVLYGGDGDDRLWGNSGNDRMAGDGGQDILRGGGGSDTLNGGAGQDELFGNSGDDLLIGDDGDDLLFGSSGDDTLEGGNGADALHGGSGDDRLTGGLGADTLEGQSGDDWFFADAGNDTIIGGSGWDTLDFSGFEQDLSVNLHSHKASGAGYDRVEGIEAVIGSAGDDTFTGDKRANRIDGGDGDDWIRGLGGDDVLSGGKGNDVFFWRAKDTGNPSDDSFVDEILDFEAGDKLVLEGFGNEGEEDGVASSIQVSKADGKTILSYDTAGDGTGMTTFAVLSNGYDINTTTDVTIV